MQAELKAIFTVDMDRLDLFRPPDGGNFLILVRAMIGPKNGLGSESFDLRVSTPSWLASECEQFGFVTGRYLIVAEYDPALITMGIASIVDKATGSSWQDIAKKLSRQLSWEFADYQDTKEE